MDGTGRELKAQQEVLADLKNTFGGVEIKDTATILKFSLAIESAAFRYVRNTTDSMASLNLENCGRIFNSNTALILLAPRTLAAPPNFGQVKLGQKGPTATFHPRHLFPYVCICSISPFFTITISLFVFKEEAEE